LQYDFCPLSKLDYTKVSRANVIKCRPYGKNDLPTVGSTKAVNGISVKMLQAAIDHCTRAYLHIPPQYILAMGGISLYALTGEKSITDWRGWCIGSDGNGKLYGIKDYYNPTGFEPYKIFPVIHIASLFQSAKYYHATLLDF